MKHHSFMKGSAFTHNGDYFAIISVDGRVRIWDTLSGKIIREFSPLSINENSCTCLCWTRENKKGGHKVKEPKRKKKRIENPAAENHYPSVVVGATNGLLWTIDSISGKQYQSFDSGQKNDITFVCYNSQNDMLYTSASKYITEWSYEKEEIISKWKGDDLVVETMCVGPSGKTLISAGQSIKIWNLETKKIIQRFNGHSSTVSILKFTSYCVPVASSTSPDDGCYFLSAGQEDRQISVWQINSSRPTKSCIASYLVSDVPITADSFIVKKDNKPLKLCAGCRDGKIHLFETVINGKSLRPIEAEKTWDVLQKDGKKGKAKPADFFNMYLSLKASLNVKLAYGNSVKPAFENMDFSCLGDVDKIIKDVSGNFGSVQSNENEDKPIENAQLSVNSQVLGNQTFVPAPVEAITDTAVDINSNQEDRQRTETLADMLSMEERLKGGVLEVDEAKSDLQKKLPTKMNKPNAGSFSQMLIQGLHTNDDSILSDILFNNHNEQTVRNTIKRIPNEMVIQLLMLVIDKLQQNPLRSKSLTIWIKVIMSVHLTLIMSNEGITKSLSSLYQLLRSQQEIQPQLLNVQGKVDLLLAHSSSKNTDTIDNDEIDNPAIVFNDDSEDETSVLLFDKMTSESDGDEGISDVDSNDTSDNEGVEYQDEKEQNDDGEMKENLDSESDEDSSNENSDI